ncbi:MAG: hypothetical protein IJ233_05815, partial [Pyramidobacter sp.]|nr:hypothetical protein [Pyramidobacter sp.]
MNRSRAFVASVLAELAALCAWLYFAAGRFVPPPQPEKAPPPAKVVIGTFNIENFDMTSPQRSTHYTHSDALALARSIRSSGAAVLALQE